MNSGFIINKLRLTGESVDNTEVNFQKGANIISGPSNTGKTYIFQCINYMFGGTTRPKNIKESRRYTSVYLELTAYNNIVYTLKSDLKGGDFQLFQSEIDHITFDENYTVLARKHDPKSENTISAFFQKLNNAYPKKIRMNAKGKIRQISYRDIVKFLLINEERIITEGSLIETHYTKSTEEKNLLKYIISGIDDSEVIESMNKNEITNRKGRLELIKELIIELNDDIDKLKKDESLETFDELERRIEGLNNAYSEINKEFTFLNLEKSKNYSEIQIKNRKKRELDELFSRSSLLKQHYETDIKRLKSTIETSLLLKDRNTSISHCPLCQNEIPHDCNVQDLGLIMESCEAEINKIKVLLTDLLDSVDAINKEKNQVEENLNILDSKNIDIDLKLEKEVGFKLRQILDQINSANEKKSYLIGIKSKEAQILKYIAQKEKLENVLSAAKEGNNFETLSTANMTLLSKTLEKILEEINYPDLTAVSYSEENSDFVISGEDRALFGKGYRAIVYASFIVAIQHLLFDKPYSIGIPVIDSPLVTYKKADISEEDLIPVDLAQDYYRYIAKDKLLNQIIIIENVEPPSDILDEIHHVSFTRSYTTGRYGFFPKL